jgi:FMN reductase
MKSLNIVAVNGSLSSPSRTRVLVDTVLDRLSARVPIGSQHVIDLAELGPALAGSLDFRNLPLTVAAAIDRIEQADVLIAASPIYRGAYTGLFKHLFDLVGQDALIGKPVLLAATGGSERHSLALDHVFRPLFGFFRSHTVPSGVYASSADFADQTIINPATRARIDEAVGQIVTLVRGTHGIHLEASAINTSHQPKIGAYAAGA